MILQNNLGFNSIMKASQIIKVDDYKENIVELEENYSIDKIIKNSNEGELFEKEIDEFEELKLIENIDSTQNGKYITEVIIDHLQKKAKFKFKLELEEEGNIKKPRVVASVINTIKPEKVIFKIKEKYGTCGEIVEEIVLYFQNKNINYTTYIDFNTNLTNINKTIISNFALYHHSTEKYENKENNNKVYSYLLGFVICYNNNICQETEILERLKIKNIEKKKFNKTIIIPLNL